jgi:hypothetical protein
MFLKVELTVVKQRIDAKTPTGRFALHMFRIFSSVSLRYCSHATGPLRPST